MAMANDEKIRPSLTGALVALVIGGLITIVLAEVALRFLDPHWREFYSGRFMEQTFVAGFGEVHIGKPGFDGYFAQNNGDFRTRVTINRFGLRNDEPVAAAAGKIWVIGDSMAFGWGVERSESYTDVIQRIAGVGTYNVASPGADVCGYQALAARMEKKTEPRAVLVGLIIENDILDYDCPRGRGPAQPASSGREGGGGFLPTLAQVKYGLTQYSALYNFVSSALKRIGMVNDLLSNLGLIARPHEYRAAFDPGEVERRVDRTVSELVFLRSMFSPETPFVVLICPARFDVRDGDPFFTGLKRAVADRLTTEGIRIIDATPALRTAGFEKTHLPHDGHWSVYGHRVVGAAVASWAKEISG